LSPPPPGHRLPVIVVLVHFLIAWRPGPRRFVAFILGRRRRPRRLGRCRTGCFGHEDRLARGALDPLAEQLLRHPQRAAARWAGDLACHDSPVTGRPAGGRSEWYSVIGAGHFAAATG